MEVERNKCDINIAIFDSGIGGLNLLKACNEALPQANYYYIADNYNVPYGSKTKGEMLELVNGKLSLVSDVPLSAAVMACNTVTSNCIDDLRKQYSFPIIGIQPAIKPAAKLGGRCLVLATPATLSSPSFNKLLAQVGNGQLTKFIVHPCEGLAQYIEDNIFVIEKSILEGALPNIKTDSVVLGCTHYIYIKDIVKQRYNCKIFDGIAGTVAHILFKLGIGDHFCPLSGIGDHLGLKKSNITFLGGDYSKNARVFAHLTGL